MLIGARMAAWGGEKLPYDEELEYIESNGNQYIKFDNIAIIMRDKMICKISEINVGHLTGQHTLIGARDGYTNDAIAVYPDWYAAWYNSKSLNPFSGKSFNFIDEWTVGRYERNLKRNGVIIKYDYTEITGEEKEISNYYLFSSNYSFLQSKYVSGRFYELKVYRDDSIIIDAFCVLKDGIPCVYDKIGKKTYYNKTAGHQFGYKKKDGTIVAPT